VNTRHFWFHKRRRISWPAERHLSLVN